MPIEDWIQHCVVTRFLYDWQALGAGFLAAMAAIGTIWVTRSTANQQITAAREQTDREIAANREQADREIAASREQTSVAQEQIATTIHLERLRDVHEDHAFYAMLDAVMSRVLADAVKAKQTCSRTNQTTGESDIAYEARQSFAKRAFPEFLEACVRYGRFNTVEFPDLDNDIDDFASRWREIPTAIPGKYQQIGQHGSLQREIGAIEDKATRLREEAVAGMERAKVVIAEITKLR